MMTRRSLAASAAVIGSAVFSPVVEAATKLAKKIFAADPNTTPKPPYSPAVAYGNLLFVSGKASYNAPNPKDIRSCATYAFDAVEKELKNAGSSMEKVLKVQIFLADIKDYAAMNEIFAARFAVEPPARTTVAAIIPRDSLIEIDVVAYI
ncbi:RidA family protein [Terriglobus saanensis]|uniref:Endoribonuclease L-PSP n=1 Tax=Terriglobus saanensis (strain ATCC BAA-1853 / DSM 23119 / SP1PR4) TaxID=401053 RepID=E8V211_TERSS|nr:RidA family protein [Terriglobus saanensis]ADV84568.1 Endoribonuclease L-PSP [Terriglobus saanensis SP1PR4]